MKKILILVSAFLIATLAGQSADASRPSDRLIIKADEILRQTEVVSARSVGYAGTCPDANWALSVICAYHQEPTAHLLEVSHHASRAGYFMCLLGVKALDEKRFKEASDRCQQASQPGQLIELQDGCIVRTLSATEILDAVKSWPKEMILCEKIPDLVDTVRLQPHPPLDTSSLIQVNFTVPPIEKKLKSSQGGK